MISIKQGQAQLVAHILVPFCNLLRLKREDVHIGDRTEEQVQVKKKPHNIIFRTSFAPDLYRGSFDLSTPLNNDIQEDKQQARVFCSER